LLSAILVVSMLVTTVPMAAFGSAPPDGGGGGTGVAGGATTGGTHGYVDPSTVAPKFWVEPKPYVLPPRSPTLEAGRAVDGYAVLVGINAYPSAPLQGCISDITAIRDKLVNSYGWTNASIHFITDAAATPQRITQELQWLVSVAGPSSQTVFSFSGHGSAHTIYAYPMIGVTDSDVATEWVKLNSSENVLIMDSCFSGANTAANISDPATISMMACGPLETAADGATFTKAWVEGLGTTQWGNVEQAFQYAYNQIQGWQHPVMWDNVIGEMMLGRKPPVIAALPELSGLEDNPVTFTFTPYESDPVDGNALLNWSVESYNPVAIRAVAGQNSANDTLTFTPEKDWVGRTNVTIVLRNGGGRTTKSSLNITWAPVNDLPVVNRLDKMWDSVERTKEVKLIVYGNDVDNAASMLALRMEYRPKGGSWTALEASAGYVVNRWELIFSPPPQTPTGAADLRASLKDLDGWGDWTDAPGFIQILNSPPKIACLNASQPLVHRTLPLRLSVQGADAEDPPERLACEMAVKWGNETVWTTLPGANLTNDRWEAEFRPSAAAPLGLYDVRARLRDVDGTAGDWKEMYGLFFVENALPVLDSLEISAPSVARGGNVTLTVRGSDVEDTLANLTCELHYVGPAGNWMRVEGVKVRFDRWVGSFQPNAAFKTGHYSFRVMLRDTTGQLSDWLFQNRSLLVENSLPEVSVLNLSKASVLRSQNVSIRIEGKDYENKNADLGCAVEYRPAGAPSWAAVFLSEPVFDARFSVWNCLFTPPVESPVGAYEFRARLKDRDGDWGDWFLPEPELEVQNNRPAAKLASRAFVVNEKAMTYFDGTPSSDLEGPLEYAWDFGDGTTDTGENVSHIFTQGGAMTVVLTVTDQDGAQANESFQLRVNLLPKAEARSKQASGVHDFRVRFNGTPSSDAEGPVAYMWDFDTAKDTSGDGLPDNDIDSSSQFPSFDYKRAGTYLVKLTVVDGDNATATTVLTVKVRRVDADTTWMTWLGVLVAVAVVAAGAAVAARRKGKAPPEARAWDPAAELSAAPVATMPPEAAWRGPDR
jgi:chitodextrinase